MSKKKTKDEYVAELASKNPTIQLIGQYINNRTPTTHYCTVHDVYWDTSPNTVLKGCGCEKCRGEKIGQSLRKSENQYVQELALNNPLLTLVGTYTNANTPTDHYCKIHKIVSKITPFNALHGAGCVKCHYEKIGDYNRKSEHEYVLELAVKNPTVQLIGSYINAMTPTAHFCNVHHTVWDIVPFAALQGQGCQLCKNERIGNMLRKNKEQYIQELSLVNQNIVLCGEYKNANTPTLHKCLIHDYEWLPTPSNVLRGHGCPKCNESKGEAQIEQWLARSKIENISQKRFVDCCDIKPLPFDFYIPSLNVCIEYQGEQHYRPVNFGGVDDKTAYDNFVTTQRHDAIKKDYCLQNNIKLFCIPYFENVDFYLNKNLLI